MRSPRAPSRRDGLESLRNLAPRGRATVDRAASDFSTRDARIAPRKRLSRWNRAAVVSRVILVKSLETVVVASCLCLVATSAHAREASTCVLEFSTPVPAPAARPLHAFPRTPLDLAFAVWAE